MKRNSHKFKKVLLFLISFLLIFSVLAVTTFLEVKPLVFTYAKSTAETVLLNAANEAILKVLNKNNITYSKISNVSRDADNNITGIEIDIELINALKSSISNEISKIVAKNNIYDMYILVGTLFGNEYTTGFGPKINFKMQLTETAVVDFKSLFSDAGINQVLHQIIIKIDISANILMIGFTEGFSVHTSAIAAQTVIVGGVPDSFTNVIERPGDDIADEIFNYSVLD